MAKLTLTFEVSDQLDADVVLAQLRYPLAFLPPHTWTFEDDEVLAISADEDGTSGQDREGYSDEQDRDSYTVR